MDYKKIIDKIGYRKPIDVILNPRFKNGVFLKPKRAIEVFDGEMQVEIQESAFSDFKKITCEKCKDLRTEQISLKCGCYRKYYTNQRKLQLNDGMLYYIQGNQKTKASKNVDASNLKVEQQFQSMNSKSELLKNKSANILGDVNMDKIQMLVCVTMYNESFEMLERTLGGIQQNLRSFVDDFGLDPKNFACIVLQDGIEKVNQGTKQNLFDKAIDEQELGLPDLEFDPQNPKIVTSDIQDPYEKEVKLLQTKTAKYRLKMIQHGRKEIADKLLDPKKYITSNNNFPGNVPKNVAQIYQVELDYVKDGTPKLTTIFCNKHLNGRKLSSHLWFFQGFCRLIQPKYLALVDVGTMPDSMGLVNYYKALEQDDSVGGVSGFMGLYFEKQDDRLQIFEYQQRKKYKMTPEEWASQSEYDRKVYCQKLRDTEKQIQEKEQELEDSDNEDENNQQQDIEGQYQRRKTWAQKYSLPSNVLSQYLEDVFNTNTTRDAIVHQESKIAKYKSYAKQILELEKNQTLIDQKRKERMQQLEGQQDKGKKSFLDQIGKCFLKVLYFIFLKIHLYFDVKKAQVFEYALAHYSDKNFESCFGFLQVLPGAWSCYRYSALNRAQAYKENLVEKKYLKGILNPNIDPSSLSLEENNMYLAEDRILCLGIFSQPDHKFTLKYVPTARAYTDAIDNNIEFMLQRRRWINSTWFALNYVIRNYKEHLKNSRHGWLNKQVGIPLMMYMTFLGQVNAYLLIGFFAFALYSSATQLFIPIIDHYNLSKQLHLIPMFFLIGYALIVIFLLYLSLNIKIGKNNNSYKLYGFISGIFGTYNVLVFVLVIYNVFVTYIVDNPIFDYQNQSSSETDVIKIVVLILIGLTTGTIAVMVAVQCMDIGSMSTVLKMALAVPSYVYYSAMYTHTLLLYAFCNIDDFSWGTKGSSDDGGSANTSYRDFKIYYMAKWLFWNSLLAFFLVAMNEYFGGRGYVVLGIGGYAGIQLGIKFVFSFWNHMHFYFLQYTSCFRQSKNTQYKQLRKNIQETFATNIQKSKKIYKVRERRSSIFGGSVQASHHQSQQDSQVQYRN